LEYSSTLKLCQSAFFLSLAWLVATSGPLSAASTLFGVQNRVSEWGFRAAKPHADPFNEVELDVLITDPQGRQDRVPAFWAGDQDWTVRYSPPTPGRYQFRTICNDTSDLGLHGQEGTLEVSPYTGDNPLFRHGPIRIAADQRHFQHADGTPFFWLGDTWWMGLCQRLRWPEDFEVLTADRIAKGFTVVQIVAGLYPDMPPFDPRGANEAGCPWDPSFTHIRPAYFDMADLRIEYLVNHGLVPCVVGSWGYFLPKMGVERVKQHWRYLVARWGAFPVMWCLAGEGTMPDYLSTSKQADAALQKHGWTEVARYVRQIDPYHHPISIHPSQNSRDTLEDPALLDFDMLQTGHNDRASLPNTVQQVTHSLERSPRMPVVDAEPCYEGILEAGRQEVQRLLFWACLLSGAGGHTYGANGLWQVNTASQPFGPSPHGRSWGDTPWDEAYRLPGSKQLGLGKALLLRYPWWRFEPHPEWVEPHWTKDNYILPYAAGIPGGVRFVYTPARWDLPRVRELDSAKYTAFLFSPTNGKRYDLGRVAPDDQASWQPPVPPIVQDWVMVLEASH
jgi:hypothetical protein